MYKFNEISLKYTSNLLWNPKSEIDNSFNSVTMSYNDEARRENIIAALFTVYESRKRT